MKMLLESFDSNLELYNFLEKTDFVGKRKNKTPKFVLEKLITGDSYNIEKIEMGYIKSLGNKSKTKFDFYGQIPVVSKALQGDPYCFLNRKKVLCENKFITICYDIGCPWYVSSSEIIQSGTKMLNVINYLEENGYRVRLYSSIVAADFGKNTSNVLLVKLKEFEEILSLGRVAFNIANPDFLREIFFEFCDKSKKYIFMKGYGTPVIATNKTNCKNVSIQFSHLFNSRVVYTGTMNFLEYGNLSFEEIANRLTELEFEDN